jgi:enoyl-CoA hydratase
VADERFVVVERDGEDGVAVLRLDRPKANALSAALLEQLAEAAEGLIADPPGAVVVTGGDRIFAAGADIAEFTTDGKGQLVDEAEARSISVRFRRACDALAAIPRLTVAAIEGYALGGGCEVALSCDLRVASEAAKLGQPEILLGIIPGGGGTQRLARLIGAGRAKDLILTGRQVPADEALALGLVDRVVPKGEATAAARELAASVAKGALAAQALAKKAIDDGLDEPTLSDGLALETALFGDAFATEDAATGVRSFLESGPGKARFAGR